MSNSAELSIEASNFKTNMLKLKQLALKRADLEHQISKYNLEINHQYEVKSIQNQFLFDLDDQIKKAAREPATVQRLIGFEKEVKNIISNIPLQITTEHCIDKLNKLEVKLKAAEAKFKVLNQEMETFLDKA